MSSKKHFRKPAESESHLTREQREKYIKWFEKIGCTFDWAQYKNENVFIDANLAATHRAKKPMFNICYCATEAMNGTILYVAQYDKNKFKLPNYDK